MWVGMEQRMRNWNGIEPSGRELWNNIPHWMTGRVHTCTCTLYMNIHVLLPSAVSYAPVTMSTYKCVSRLAGFTTPSVPCAGEGVPHQGGDHRPSRPHQAKRHSNWPSGHAI